MAPLRCLSGTPMREGEAGREGEWEARQLGRILSTPSLPFSPSPTLHLCRALRILCLLLAARGDIFTPGWPLLLSLPNGCRMR